MDAEDNGMTTLRVLCVLIASSVVMSASDLQKAMIWASADTVGYGSYTVFRKGFDLAECPSCARMLLFADSRYLLWINGRYVLRGPCRFDPKRPEYDVVDCASYLRKGRNAIVVLVHNYGGALNGRIKRHVPGLGLVLEAAGKEVLRTDSTWRYCAQTRYRPSPGSWNTVPDVIDGRVDACEWTGAEFVEIFEHLSRDIMGIGVRIAAGKP